MATLWSPVPGPKRTGSVTQGWSDVAQCEVFYRLKSYKEALLASSRFVWRTLSVATKFSLTAPT